MPLNKNNPQSVVEDANLPALLDKEPVSSEEVNERVLNPKFTPMIGCGKLLADQASGLLMQDVTSFSQGFMQMMMIAIAKCTAKIVETDGVQGEKSLTDVQAALEKLPDFVTKMSSAAVSMQTLKP